MYIQAFPLFHQHQLISWRLATPLVCLSVVSWSPFGPSCRFPCVLEVFHLISHAGRCFLPPSCRGSYSTSGLALHSSSTPIVIGLCPVVGFRFPPECPGARFFGHCLLGAWPVAWEPRSNFSLLPAAAGFFGGVFYESLTCPPPYVVLGWCGVGSMGQLFDSCVNSCKDFPTPWVLIFSWLRYAAARC
jgi:hypothetical protein